MHFSDILANPYTFDPAKLRFLGALVEQHPYCQPARMLYAKALSELGEAGFESEAKQAMAAAPNRKLFREYLSKKPGESPENNPLVAKEEKARMSEDDKRYRQQGIIDRFLKEEPRIQPASSAIPEGDLARESIEDNPDLVSETLAEILLTQGKKERAIMIYNKLSLMFPEKSSYFAKKMEQIQNKEY